MINILENQNSKESLDECYDEKKKSLFKKWLTKEELIKTLEELQKINEELDREIFKKG